MTPDDLRVLAGRADVVEGRPGTRLAQVHARIDRARRQRLVGALVATAVAVVLALTAGTAVVKLTDTAPPPAKPPAPTRTPKVDDKDVSAGRSLVWAKGRVVHIGDRKIDVGGKVWEVEATDTGAVFMRQGKGDCFKDRTGCNELWLTDGNEITHVGTVYGSVIRGFSLQGSTSGSTLVWFEPSPEAHRHGSGYDLTGEWVVYDAAQRREVARMDAEGADTDRDGHPHLIVQAVFDDYVYWTPDDRAAEWCMNYSKYYVACRRFTAVMRLDTSTGTQSKVPWAAFVSDRNSRPRMFSRPIRGESDTPGPVYDETIDFLRNGDRLEVDDGDGNAVAARVASTGELVRLRVPEGYRDADYLELVAWLDDDHVVLSADDESELELLVCRLPDGRCRIAVRHAWQADFGAHG